MPLTGEAHGELLAYVDRLLAELDVTDQLWPDVLDSKHRKKSRQVVNVRDRLIWHLRTRCWQDEDHCFLIDHDPPRQCGGAPCELWSPLSHPNIGKVLGLDPSTVTLSLNRTRKKRQEEDEQRKRIPKEFWDIPIRFPKGDAPTAESR